MKIAIISDIHGNLTALDTILPKMEDADRVICLGDVAAVGPQPRRTIALLRKMKWPCVVGNADETLARSVLEDFSHLDASQDEKKRLVALDKWTAAQLDPSDRGFLSRLKPTIEVIDSQVSLLCYHGSPRSNTEGILATTPDEQVSEMLRNRKAMIFAGGHTHSQMVRRLGGAIVMNPGSVGLPFEKDSSGKSRNPTWAEYSMVKLTGKDLSVEMCRAKYDLAELERAVRGSGMPNPDWWLEGWF